MPATSAASLALAARLRDLDDALVARVITERGITPSSLRDVFDLAEALLDPSALTLALAGLSRPTLAALATAAESEQGMTLDDLAVRLERSVDEVENALAPAVDALLVDRPEGRVMAWPAVAAELASWPSRGLPSALELRTVTSPPTLHALTDVDYGFLDRGAAERAFATTTAVTEVVLALADAPGRLLARGGLSLPDAKRLATVASTELDDVPALVDVATLAGLIDEGEGYTRPTERGDSWRRLGPAQRWAALAQAWLRSLPPDLVTLLSNRVDGAWGAELVDVVNWLYPAAEDSLVARLQRRGLQADRLGITAERHPSSMGRALLTVGADAAADVLASLIPPEVEQVYLQHDLTIVSPGPLAGPLDERLRRVADVEAAGIAGRYRISSDSVTRAIALGESAETLTEFLESISLTGVPQPLAYLIDETARRYGTVRVSALDDPDAMTHGARSIVRSSDRLVLEAILVDAATTSLSLRRIDPQSAVSRVEAAVALWILIDARYPAAAAEGTVTPERPGRARPRTVAPPVDDSVAAAVARIRSGSTVGIDGDGAWVARQWQLALRGKLTVRATVQLPDGSERVFDLEPTGIAAGRLRGRDMAADIERTLPITSITALTPLE